MTDLVKQLAARSIHIFLEAYQITNDQGERLDFKDHPYLWDIYEDWSPYQVILKAAQVGMSTCMNIKVLWAAKYKKLDLIYSLPAANDVKDFVAGKTNRLIAFNKPFLEWTEDKDSIEQKRVGSNVIYFKGTWTDRAALATPADGYISDETDRSKQENVAQFETRLQHSKHGWRWYLSNPSSADVGVDKHWKLSDQKEWFVKCPSCGFDWYLTMDNILYNDDIPYFGCTKCGVELDRRKGRWVAKYPERDISGYHISLLMVPHITASYILDKKKSYSEEQFCNFVLGLPYVGRGNKLVRPMFMQNVIDATNPRDKRTIIGVDTGSAINFVMGNDYGLFYHDKVESYAPLKKIMMEEKDAIMIIDQGGDIIGPREMREQFPNRVFLCYFRRDQKNDTQIRWNDNDGSVIVDRNKLIQLCVDELTYKRMPMFGTEPDWEDVWLEWAGMYRTTEVDSLGMPVHTWNKPPSGRADYPFCYVYWRVGMDRYKENKSTFHEPTTKSFAFQGLDVQPGGGTHLPKP